MVVVLFCLILFCSALALAVLLDRRIEGTMPLAVMLLISLLYFSGFYGNLEWGVYAVMLLGLMSLAWLLYCMVKKKEKPVSHVSPYLLFFILFVLWMYQNYHGMVLSEWDEFTHWGLSTKIMYDSNLFSNQPGSTCYFVDYLPGTALFQYFMQKLNGEYAEWCSVMAQGIFLYVFPFSCLERLKVSRRGMVMAGIAALTVFMLPEGFYSNVYRLLYVDASLAVVFAYVLFCHFSAKEKDVFYYLNMSLALGVLCIIKPSGIGLMALAAVIIVGDNLATGTYRMLFREKKYSLLVLEILPFLTGWLYKFFWSLRMDALGYAAHFDTGRITLQSIWNVIVGKGEQYQKETVTNFYNAFVGIDKTKIFTGSLLCYILLFVLITFFIIRIQKSEKKRWLVFAVLSAVSFVMYSLYMLALYLFTYSMDEAVRLASFSRYEYTIILGLIMSQVMLLLVFMINSPDRKVYEVLSVLFCVIFMVPNQISLKLSNDEELLAKQELRRNYELADRAREKLSENDKVYLIANGSDGYDYWILRYNLSPIHAQTRAYDQLYTEISWDIGNRYEGETAVRVDYSPDEWMEKLVVGGYTYVLLYHIDDNFKTEYAQLFADGVPAERQLYFVNRETRKLEMVEMNR